MAERTDRDAAALARATDEALSTEQDADQTAADLDQTQAETDQAGADDDQAASDDDREYAARDQHASDRDQAAADWEESEAPPDTAADRARQTSRAEREAATRERDSTAAGRARTTGRRLTTAARRDEVARVRDLVAAARDRAADARDRAADARDRAAEARERRAAAAGTPDADIAPLRTIRLAGAASRHEAALERAAAAADREAAAADRAQAATDRRYAGLDELTGVFRRGTGELALTHEIDRSRRSGRPLVLALIDVDDLKAVNDSDGHAAGDRLLRDVATAIGGTMRSYDVIVRWGGDEFVCALSDVTFEVAGDRLVEIQRALDSCHPGATISAGLALLEDGDSLERVIARADSALYTMKLAREAQ
jgi:diguanylate cyclase (GGDEF)-like protein